MTWNYRIIRHPEHPASPGSGYLALHEVCYEDGKACSFTQDPIGFLCDFDEGPAGIIGSLEMALRDAKTRPILELTLDGEIIAD